MSLNIKNEIKKQQKYLDILKEIHNYYPNSKWVDAEFEGKQISCKANDSSIRFYSPEILKTCNKYKVYVDTAGYFPGIEFDLFKMCGKYRIFATDYPIVVCDLYGSDEIRFEKFMNKLNKCPEKIQNKIKLEIKNGFIELMKRKDLKISSLEERQKIIPDFIKKLLAFL